MHQCKNCNGAIKDEHVFCCYCGFESEPQLAVLDVPGTAIPNANICVESNIPSGEDIYPEVQEIHNNAISPSASIETDYTENSSFPDLSGITQSSEYIAAEDSVPLLFPDLPDIATNSDQPAPVDSNILPGSEIPQDTENVPFPDLFDAAAQPLPFNSDNSIAHSANEPFPDVTTQESELLPFPDIPEERENNLENIHKSEFPIANSPFPDDTQQEADFPVLDDTQQDLEAEDLTRKRPQQEPWLDETQTDMEAVPFPEIENELKSQNNASEQEQEQATPSIISTPLHIQNTEEAISTTLVQDVHEAANPKNAGKATVNLEKLLETKKEPEYCDMCGEIKAEGAIYCTACGCPI